MIKPKSQIQKTLCFTVERRLHIFAPKVDHSQLGSTKKIRPATNTAPKWLAPKGGGWWVMADVYNDAAKQLGTLFNVGITSGGVLFGMPLRNLTDGLLFEHGLNKGPGRQNGGRG